MDTTIVERALISLVPTINGPPPRELVQLATALLAQSRSKAGNLKRDEEIARAYACTHLACERLKHALNLPKITANPPCPPRIYQKLYKYFDQILPSRAPLPTRTNGIAAAVAVVTPQSPSRRVVTKVAATSTSTPTASPTKPRAPVLSTAGAIVAGARPSPTTKTTTATIGKRKTTVDVSVPSPAKAPPARPAAKDTATKQGQKKQQNATGTAAAALPVAAATKSSSSSLSSSSQLPASRELPADAKQRRSLPAWFFAVARLLCAGVFKDTVPLRRLLDGAETILTAPSPPFLPNNPKLPAEGKRDQLPALLVAVCFYLRLLTLRSAGDGPTFLRDRKAAVAAVNALLLQERRRAGGKGGEQEKVVKKKKRDSGSGGNSGGGGDGGGSGSVGAGVGGGAAAAAAAAVDAGVPDAINEADVLDWMKEINCRGWTRLDWFTDADGGTGFGSAADTGASAGAAGTSAMPGGEEEKGEEEEEAASRSVDSAAAGLDAMVDDDGDDGHHHHRDRVEDVAHSTRDDFPASSRWTAQNHMPRRSAAGVPQPPLASRRQQQQQRRRETLQVGPGTMMTARVDYLSAEKRADYREWRARIVQRIVGIEKTAAAASAASAAAAAETTGAAAPTPTLTPAATAAAAS